MKWLTKFSNIIFLSRIKVVIKTKQFLGSQEKFYLLEQTGWLNLITLKFTPIKKLGGQHIVHFRTIKNVLSAVVKWL
jgi:hypothetical protein